MKNQKYQEFLNMLLDKEMNRMRLMIYKRKRRPLLNNKVTIHIAAESTADNIGGYYRCAKQDNGADEHQIYINRKDIERHINIRRFNVYHSILKTIRHELTHAFVNEKFSPLSNITGIHMDCSPLFIDCLEYFKCGTSSHPSNIAFDNKYGFAYHHKFDNWEWDTQMLPHLLDLINEYNVEIKRLEYVLYSSSHLCNCNYRFGGADCCGLEASQRYTSIISTPQGNATVSILDFNIGSCVTPKDLEKYTRRKINNGLFKFKQIGKYDATASRQDKYNTLKLKSKFI